MKCEYCEDTGKIESDNNGPILDCPLCVDFRQMIKTYRKKPVEIQAIKWTGSNLEEVLNFTGRDESSIHWTMEYFEGVVREHGLKIFTLEGSHMASIGDFIIKGVADEFYPCNPDIFKATYELVSQHAEELGDR